MSLPRELRNRTRSPSIALITRTPSHLISNAQPVSSDGNVPVTAFIGRMESRSSTFSLSHRDGDPLVGRIGLVSRNAGQGCNKHTEIHEKLGRSPSPIPLFVPIRT